ncbi:MAG: hypothetical protein ABSF46_00800 [Terriglobia bacterium]|jgi:hypothetical protein
MDNKRWDLASDEEIADELARITSTDFDGFARTRGYEAAFLLAKMHSRFSANPGKQSILGFSYFTDWVKAFCKARGITSRTVWYYAKAGRFLLPHNIGEDEFEALSVRKREILADLAERGKLTQELLKDSFVISDGELRKKADPLRERELPWEDRLEINSHEAAIAALLQLGNLLDYKTYTAHPGDQFEGKRLGDIATLTDFPRFPTVEIERSAKRIDVIWVNIESWPEFFFEVEPTTGVTSGLQRMYQVRKSEAKFLIVAPDEVRPRFFRAISESPYKHYRDKYLFRSYTELKQMFQAALRYRKASDRFFAQ